MITRRDFISKTACAASLLPLSAFPLQQFMGSASESGLDINIFSKHLQFLDYKATGEMAAEIGFSGVDLTVRPNGHVLPELVKTDLPKAVKAIKASGIHCHMMTTSIESINNKLDVDILEAAASENINYYRTNWFKYKEDASMQDSLLFYQNEVKKLGDLNEKLGLIGCYQNHAGVSVGASYWEIQKILETTNPKYFGTQYDIRHAMVEGGYSWENGFKLLHPNIKVIVLKDFKWGQVNGKWQAINVPIGEGMVDFDTYFKLLKKHQLKPPVSLHLEYDLGGAERGERKITVDKKVVFDAMKSDLKKVQQLWKNA
ncbi:sugar phosphate isomerase/epimerase family protein [Mariniflexile sp. AS56]|uniref:sugar phosphate isomerase/epimerase family protein n=1 Tax=Mariniflexile sp. AS56 TaxID=3063957 RepID=UPI0026EFA994|nr:sugar phosphate isomerase/epimerase family protein [Mariniflexile sp. AS56]MDO7173273.1 sugar phosphate isomerase/epimerase family protein [Mariniflexile sp. AS56]